MSQQQLSTVTLESMESRSKITSHRTSLALHAVHAFNSIPLPQLFFFHVGTRLLYSFSIREANKVRVNGAQITKVFVSKKEETKTIFF